MLHQLCKLLFRGRRVGWALPEVDEADDPTKPDQGLRVRARVRQARRLKVKCAHVTETCLDLGLECCAVRARTSRWLGIAVSAGLALEPVSHFAKALDHPVDIAGDPLKGHAHDLFNLVRSRTATIGKVRCETRSPRDGRCPVGVPVQFRPDSLMLSRDVTRSEGSHAYIVSSSSMKPLIMDSPLPQNAGSEASRPKGASSSLWRCDPPAVSMAKYLSSKSGTPS